MIKLLDAAAFSDKLIGHNQARALEREGAALIAQGRRLVS
jgi:hypothetical protein